MTPSRTESYVPALCVQAFCSDGGHCVAMGWLPLPDGHIFTDSNISRGKVQGDRLSLPVPFLYEGSVLP